MINKKRKILSYIGLAPIPEEEEMIEIINITYKSAKVSRRGGISICAEEVINNPEFKGLDKIFKSIIEGDKKRD